MKKLGLLVATMATLVSADVTAKLGTYAAFQGQTRKDFDGNLEMGFVRAELYSTVSSDIGIGAFVRIRMQNLKVNGGRGNGGGDDFQIVNAQFNINPLDELLQFHIGRWEENYKENALHYGRYLFGNDGISSGSFLTQETSVDAIKAITAFGTKVNNEVHVALLPQTDGNDWSNFNNINLMTRWQGAFLEKKLRLDIGGNFAVARENDDDKIHRMTFNGEYDLWKDISIRGELGLLNLEDLDGNVWGTWGLSIPTGGILDMAAVDFELNKTRNQGETWLGGGTLEDDFNLGWFVHVAKVFKEHVRWDIGFGVDPGGDSVNSRKKGDIGVVSRIGLRF